MMRESLPESRDGLRADIRRVNQQGLKARSKMTVPEWADRFRRLSSSTGAIGGPWRTSRVEVARGPMMAITEPGVKTISIMSCTQLMKTSVLENAIGYFVTQDPCPILLTQPKDEAAKKFSKERLAPMIRSTPVLKDILGDLRTRRGDDTIQYKEFPGGLLALESAGSPTNLAMRAIRITLMDEIDKYETTKEGDPIALGEERTATFPRNRLNLRTCSPTWSDASRIFDSYLEGDQRRPYVACPHCKYWQVLDFFRHVHWSKSEDGEHHPMTAAIYCENCGAEWTEAQRMRAITTQGAIRWRQTRPFVCCGERQEPIKTRHWKWDSVNQIGRAACVTCHKEAVPNLHASFGYVGKLYAPQITVPELAAKWVTAKDDPEAKQTFYNTQLGLPYEAQSARRIDSHALAKRKEAYAAPVPAGVIRLTAGVDVQAGSANNEGRIEVEVVGWGRGEESWSIHREVLKGDPAKPEVWAALDELLLRGFEYERGGKMIIGATCIDSGGHNTQEVYAFARARITRNVWAIKGAADRSGQWSPVWPIPKQEVGKWKRAGYKPVIIGVNAAKEAIRQKLLVEEPGPGFCHFGMDWTDGLFEQLTSESLVIENKAGVKIRKWVLPKGRANEGLDVRVYAYAALCGLYAVRKLNLDRAAEALEMYHHNTPAPAAPASGGAAPAIPAPAPEPVRPKVRRSSFMG